jgi:hypothetical protein
MGVPGAAVMLRRNGGRGKGPVLAGFRRTTPMATARSDPGLQQRIAKKLDEIPKEKPKL